MATEICRRAARTSNGRATIIVLQRENGAHRELFTKTLTADGRLIEGLTAQITLMDDMDERTAVERVIGRTTAKLEAAARVARERVDYRTAYATLSAEEKDKLCPPEWRAQSTRKAALAFFERNSIGVLQQLLDGDSNDEAALVRAQEQMLDIVKANQSARRNPEISEAQLENLDNQARAVADQHIVEGNKLVQASRLALPQFNLPAIWIPRLIVDKIIPLEQCKALPRDTMVRLAALMWLDIPMTALAVGGILMLCCLLRPAEVCPKFGEILDCGSYGVYAVLTQAGRGTRVVSLKTEAAYRLIILPRYAMDAIRARRAALETQGYSAEQIANAYIVSRDSDLSVPADPKVLSGYVRMQLERLGCREDYWAAVSLLAAREPDRDENGGNLADPTAYLLRRSGCSYLTNCAAAPLIAGAKMPLYKLVDLLMGHALSGSDSVAWQKWLRRDDNWPLVAQVLETIVLDPDHSAHPAFGGGDGCADHGDRVCHAVQRHVVQEGESKITIQIRCHGTDEAVVRLPDHCKVLHREQQLQSKFDSRMPVIQEMLDLEFYEKSIKSAHKMWEATSSENGGKAE
jgi:hypothetical protein